MGPPGFLQVPGSVVTWKLQPFFGKFGSFSWLRHLWMYFQRTESSSHFWQCAQLILEKQQMATTGGPLPPTGLPGSSFLCALSTGSWNKCAGMAVGPKTMVPNLTLPQVFNLFFSHEGPMP